MSESANYAASCFCGDVQLGLRGEPEAMAYCHCNSCRQWSASPVSAFTLWKPDSVEITRGSEKIDVFDKNPGSEDKTVVSRRIWCKNCGGHVYTDHPTMGLVDIPAVLISGLDFKPGFHVHYQDTVHAMHDGLPKFKDLPEEAGGSGLQLPE